MEITPQLLTEILEQQPELKPISPVAFDTETSGLFVDAGATVSTVSIAWLVNDSQADLWRKVLGRALQKVWDSGIWTLRREKTWNWKVTHGPATDGQYDWVLSFAWPFDQGVVGTGKPEDPTDSLRDKYREGLFLDLEDFEPPKIPEDTRNLDGRQWRYLRELLKNLGDNFGLVAHNAKFDLHMMKTGTRNNPGTDLIDQIDWDTQAGADLWAAWRMADTGRTSTSLKPNAQWLWGEQEGDEKKTISEYLRKNKLPAGRWDLIPWEVIAKYADQDARLTIRYYQWQRKEQWRAYTASKDTRTPKPERGWTAGTEPDVFERRMDTMKMLTRVERRGLPFDGQLAKETAVEVQNRAQKLHEILLEKMGAVTLTAAKHYWFGVGDKLVTTNNKQPGKFVRGLGLPDYGKTATGEPTLDQAVLAKMQRDGLPLVAEWLAYKKLVDAKSKWYDGWTDRAGLDGRLRTGFRQNGTASGRFSVEEIQLQAIPADYKIKGGPLAGLPTPRDLIGAGVPDGFELWEMDLAQAELRVAAKMAGCTRMLEMIEAGADLHGYTAKELFGVDETHERWGEYRQVAKRGNFSLIFGVGWQTFSDTLWKEAGVDWGEQETREVIAAWHKLYPQFKQAIRTHEKVVLDRYRKHGVGWIVADRTNGERRWFTKWDVEQYNPRMGGIELSAHKAFNQRVQPALAQYGIDRWLAEENYLAQMGRTEGWDETAGLVLMVHDSSVLLLPEGRGMEICLELKEMGEKLWGERFPGLPGGLDISKWAAHA